MCEGKHRFVEDDVAGDDDTPGLKVKATVALVVARVSEEDARDGARSELVLCGGNLIGVAEASEDA